MFEINHFEKVGILKKSNFIALKVIEDMKSFNLLNSTVCGLIT